MPELQPGHPLAHYRLVEKIGEGGMGVVWRATDTSLNRDVAIKVLPPALSGDDERLARFEREARLLASLNHPHLAAVYGLHEDGGVHFVAMELLAGQDLAARLQEGPLPLDEAIEIARQIAAALEAAHERGIIHRDLKPANVRLAAGSEPGSLGGEIHVKLLDFGLGKILEEQVGAQDLTRSPTLTVGATRAGVILGTAAYMSPEQAHGRPADRRSDVWSFGATLYEMLTGRRPFVGESVSDTLASILRSEPDFSALPADSPGVLRRLVRRCLRKDPHKRLQSIADARVMLEDVLEGFDVPPVVRMEPRRRVAPMALAAAVGVAATVAAFLLAGARAPTATSALQQAGVPSFSRFTQLTYQAGLESSPTISPDGQFMAYTALDGLDRDIFLLRSGGRRPINLTEDSRAEEDHPAFSPDGSHIAFHSSRNGGGLFVMGATGESVRRLTDFGDNPSWSPDGTELVFATEGESDPFDRATTSSLWIVPAAGGEPRRIFEGDAVQPAWSPGGERIAFWLSGRSGIRNVATIARDGSDFKLVTDQDSVDWSPAWSGDGAGLFFASDRGGIGNVWLVPLDAGSGAPRARPMPITVPSSWAGQIGVTAAGDRMVYSTREMRSSFRVLPFDPADGRVTGPPEVLYETTLPVVDFDVAPDGLIVFRTVGSQEDIYLLQPDGHGLRKLTDDKPKDRAPRWSPDGQRVAFYSNREDGQYEFFDINRDGSDLRRLTRSDASESIWFPVWRRDGASLIGAAAGNLFAFTIGESPVTRAGFTTLEPETEHGEHYLPYALSPDGRLLTATTEGSGGRRFPGLAVLDLETGRTLRLGQDLPRSDAGMVHAGMAWLPDSRRGVFPWMGHLYLVDTGRDTFSPLETGLDLHDSAVSLSADGRSLYVLDLQVEGDIWLAARD